MTLSEIIIQYRKEHDLSQRAFALQCGVSNGYISMLEDGINRNTGKPLTPSIPKLKLVAAGMGMSLHELFGKADDMDVVLNDEPSPGHVFPSISLSLRYYRLHCGLPVHDAASRADVSPNLWLAWENGTKTPTEDELKKAASAIGVTPGQLTPIVDEADDNSFLHDLIPIKKKKFPLFGKIACGEPTWQDEEHETMIESTDTIDADFCLRAVGDSMSGSQINDGDIVFIKQMPMVDNGDIAAVLVEDETTLKRVDYNQDTGILILWPDNPAYRPQIYQGDNLNRIRILGRAVMVQKLIK